MACRSHVSRQAILVFVYHEFLRTPMASTSQSLDIVPLASSSRLAESSQVSHRSESREITYQSPFGRKTAVIPDSDDTGHSKYNLRDMKVFQEFPWLQGSVLGGDWSGEKEGNHALMLQASFDSLYPSCGTDHDTRALRQHRRSKTLLISFLAGNCRP